MAQNGNDTLLFVNKTSRSSSLSNNRSDQTSRKKINRHVQHTRDLERERDARIQRLKPTRLNLLSSSSSPTFETCSTSASPSCSTVSTLSLGESGFWNSEDEVVEEILQRLTSLEWYQRAARWNRSMFVGFLWTMNDIAYSSTLYWKCFLPSHDPIHRLSLLVPPPQANKRRCK